MKKKLLFLGCALVSTVGFSQISNDGLVGHWPFNGDALDASGNSNHGTVNGATLTTDRFGNVNSAYSFDGNASNIEVAPNTSLNLTQNMSVSFWMYLHEDVVTEGHHLIVKGSNSTNEYSLTINNTSNKGTFSKQALSNYATSKSTIEDSVWTHVVATLDYPTVKYYINGVLDTTTIATAAISSSNTSLFFGTIDGATGNKCTKGKIDDIRIFNKAIDDCQVSSIYNESNSKLKVTVQDTLNIYLSSIITTVYEPADAATTVKVYPNPTENEVTVSIDNYTNLSGVTLKVINSQSAEVHSEAVTGPTQSIDVSSWSAGIYFLQVLNGTDIVDIRKIVVNN
jgi:hypothetical protein